MELVNHTRMQAQQAMGLEPSGREWLVVVVKGTFRMPTAGEASDRLLLHERQEPPTMADTYTGAPGLSAPLHEADFALRKPRCDLLLLGTAHAPRGEPAERVEVGLQVGRWHKRFDVVGERFWECGRAALRATPPRRFVQRPFGYDTAFGGSDLRHEDPQQHAAFEANPIGVGFHLHLRPEWVDGAPMPSTEESGQPISTPAGSYRPMALGPLGRGWSTRRRYAGTYDDAWRDRHFPFLPPDFDERYYQSAPEDQQVPLGYFDREPVEVVLQNLTPDGWARFTIPPLAAPVRFVPHGAPPEDVQAVLDTVVIEPDLLRYTLTWRAARPIARNMHEIAQVVVGRRGRGRTSLPDPAAFPVPVVGVATGGST